jgi:hypothetical protein
MTAEIEWWVATTLNERVPSGGLPLKILGQIIKEVKWPQLPLLIFYIRC